MVSLHAPLFLSQLFYLDPGSGSFLIQLLLAAALGIGVAVRLYWSKIKLLFSRKNTSAPQSTEEKIE